MNINFKRAGRVIVPLLLVLGLPLTAAGQDKKSQDVIVVNPATNPVPVKAMNTVAVKSVNEPGLIPYQVYFSATSSLSGPCGGNWCVFLLPVVPAGKRLVITDFYGAVNLQAIGEVEGPVLEIWDRSGSDPNKYVLKNAFEVPQNPDAFYNVPLASPKVRYSFQTKPVMYVDAGLTPIVYFYTSPQVLIHYTDPTRITVVGYLIDLSQ